jgi:hypothetical protein
MLFLQALLALFTYDVLSTFCPFKTIYKSVKTWKIAPKQNGPRIADRVCAAVRYACVWYPKRALCLQRSFAMTKLLRKNGVAAQMVLGAQTLPFKAHAWVEVEGRPLDERSNVHETYAIWDRC